MRTGAGYALNPKYIKDEAHKVDEIRGDVTTMFKAYAKAYGADLGVQQPGLANVRVCFEFQHNISFIIALKTNSIYSFHNCFEAMIMSSR